MDKVFISYSRRDRKIADDLKSRLEGNNFKVWFDKKSIEGGKDWAQEINKGLDESYAVIVVVTNNSDNSKYVTYEWSYAIGAQKSVIPVIFERVNDLHSALEKLQHIDLSEARRRHGKWDEIYNRLNAIKYDNETTDIVPPDNIEDETLIKLVHDLNDADPSRREESIKAIRTRGRQEIEPILIQILNQDQNDRVREAAVSALAQFKTAKAKNQIINVLHSDKNNYTRKAAAVALKRMGKDQYIVKNLEKALKKDNQKIVRDAIVKSLKAIDTAESLAVIEKWEQKHKTINE